MEFLIISEMLCQGLDVYRPVVDDKGIDAVIRRDDGTYVEVQIKARSNDPDLKVPGLSVRLTKFLAQTTGLFFI